MLFVYNWDIFKKFIFLLLPPKKIIYVHIYVCHMIEFDFLGTW